MLRFKLAQNRTDTQLTNQIRTPSGKMFPFGAGQLSDDDIQAIYVYLKALK